MKKCIQSGSFKRNITSLLLVVILGLALVISLPTPAQADDDPIKLRLGGNGASSWSIVNIMPGDSGTKHVTLQNTGYRNGFVSIWISDIVSSEGINPESETGDTTEPGELIDYLVFDISCNRLRTNMKLQATLGKFPRDVSSSNYIRINPLNAGDTATLVWEWNFPETGNPQNDTQGDTLSFTINYMLEEFTAGDEGSASESSDSDTPSDPPPLLLRIDMWGNITSGQRTEKGMLLETIEAVSPDGMLTLLLPQGTMVLDNADKPVDLIEVKPVTPPEPPYAKVVIEPGYDLQPLCTFEPPVKFVLHYEPQALGYGLSEEVLVTARYDQDKHEWLEIPTTINQEANTAIASLSHCSIIALMGETTPTLKVKPGVAPFSVDISNLRIVPSQVRIWGLLPFVIRTGEEVTVTTDVVNRSRQEGIYSVILKLNGHTTATQEITLGPEQSEEVILAISGIQPGHYAVAVNGLSGEFTSSLWINWWLIGGIIATLIVIGWFIAWRLRKRKKSARITPSDNITETQVTIKSSKSGGS